MTAVGSLRFARYELAIWRRTWHGSAFSTFIAPVLYLAGIGLGIGALVADGGATDALGGVGYAAFAGTGLLAASSMQTAAGELSWPIMGAISYTRTLTATTATPLRPGDVVGGKLLLLVLRLAVAAATFAAALVLTGLVEPVAALAVIAPAILVGLACGTPMFAFAAWARESTSISYVWRFVVAPLFILSGTFFPISELPAAVQPLAALSPLWHGVELVRAAGLGLPTAHPVAVHVVVLAVVAVAGAALAVRTLTDRLQP